MRTFFLFFLLIPVALALDIYPGGILNLTDAGEIFNVTEPCYLINQTIYIYGNLSPGEHSCNITYMKGYDNPTSTGNGGGGASWRRKVTFSSPSIINKTPVISLPDFPDDVVETPKKEVEQKKSDIQGTIPTLPNKTMNQTAISIEVLKDSFGIVMKLIMTLSVILVGVLLWIRRKKTI